MLWLLPIIRAGISYLEERYATAQAVSPKKFDVSI
jgi:hypothetical protein